MLIRTALSLALLGAAATPALADDPAAFGKLTCDAQIIARARAVPTLIKQREDAENAYAGCQGSLESSAEDNAALTKQVTDLTQQVDALKKQIADAAKKPEAPKNEKPEPKSGR